MPRLGPVGDRRGPALVAGVDAQALERRMVEVGDDPTTEAQAQDRVRGVVREAGLQAELGARVEGGDLVPALDPGQADPPLARLLDRIVEVLVRPVPLAIPPRPGPGGTRNGRLRRLTASTNS